MENPDLVLQETGSRPTYSRLNYVPSGDTLRQDTISSYYMMLLVYKLVVNHLLSSVSLGSNTVLGTFRMYSMTLAFEMQVNHHTFTYD